MKRVSVNLLGLLAIVVAVSSAFTTKNSKFLVEWYTLNTSEQIAPGTSFEQSGVSTKPINQVSRYVVSDINSSQAERMTQTEADALCSSTFDTYVCAIQLDNADVNADDQLSSTELNNKLSASSYVHPQGIFFKD